MKYPTLPYFLIKVPETSFKGDNIGVFEKVL